MEVVVLSTVFVFLAGLVLELGNWLTGNSLWEYSGTGWGMFDQLIFGTVPLGVLLGWAFTGVLVGVFTSLAAKRLGWK